MSVCQFQTKGVYIVGSCSLPRYLRKRSVILIKNKHECLPVSDERCVHSRELFPATIPPQEVCDSTERFLIPQELIRLRGLKKMIK